MNRFTGFPAGKTRTIRLPESFFQSVFPMLETSLEIKTALLAFWLLEQQEGTSRFLRLDDFIQPPAWFNENSKTKIKNAVQKLVDIGLLLTALPEGYTETLYFLNSERGKALSQAYQNGVWSPGEDSTGLNVDRERRTVYQLYEENIGPLTPLIADALQDAVKTYSEDWIAEAIQIAVENNVRRWKYVEAILASWKKEGRYAQTKRDYEESYRKYFQGE